MLEDSFDSDEDELSISGGDITFNFESKEKKQEFLNNIHSAFKKIDLIKAEGYRCGHCAAFPCFRTRDAEDNAGLCFQNVRQCRQECDNYDYAPFPASGGICQIDKQKVKYQDICRHIKKK